MQVIKRTHFQNLNVFSCTSQKDKILREKSFFFLPGGNRLQYDIKLPHVMLITLLLTYDMILSMMKMMILREVIFSVDTLIARFNGVFVEKTAAVSFQGTGRLQMFPSQQEVQTCSV